MFDALATLLDLPPWTELWNTRGGTHLGIYYALLALQGLISVGVSLFVVSLMPTPLRKPVAPVFVLCLTFAFFMPVFGVLGLLVGVVLIRLLPRRADTGEFGIASTPELPQTAKGDARRFRELSVRPVLTNTSLSVALRTPALNMLTTMPVRVAGDMLQRLLVDPAEEMRLVAYGLLDRREKALRQRIFAEQTLLAASAADTSALERSLRLRALSELHFELVYQRLVQGDLRELALQQALEHADEAMAASGDEPGLLQLRARIHLESGRLPDADDDLHRALKLGAPAVRVLPYMAELAFLRSDWVEVRRLMEDLRSLPTSPRVNALVSYWTANDHPGL